MSNYIRMSRKINGNLTDKQVKFINNYPAADFMLKHKDAVKLCAYFIHEWTDYEVDDDDINFLCIEFEQKCYIGSNKWYSDKKN